MVVLGPRSRPIRWPAGSHDSLSSFGNSFEGGYLVIGVDWIKDRQEWAVTGSPIPTDEPELWLRQKAAEVVDQPRVDARAWRLPSGEYVAVIAVELSAVTPVATPDGRVLERMGALETSRFGARRRSGRGRSRGERPDAREGRGVRLVPANHAGADCRFPVLVNAAGSRVDRYGGRRLARRHRRQARHSDLRRRIPSDSSIGRRSDRDPSSADPPSKRRAARLAWRHPRRGLVATG